MEKYDIAVIGAGVLGCFAARELARYRARVCVIEQREDVCTGVSKANTGIVYSGADTKPGTLKTEMCLRANRDFGTLCDELGVRFRRCGSIMVCFGPQGEERLRRKLEQALENGVPGARLAGAEEILELEPKLAVDVRLGLLCPSTGVVNPWELGIAAFENASAAGVEFLFEHKVLSVGRSDGGFVIGTEAGEVFARGVVNCGGLFADQLREMLAPPSVRIFPDSADYLVFDEAVGGMVSHVIFHEPEEKGKGLTLVPTVDGNLMAGPSREEAGGDKEEFAVTGQGLDFLFSLCGRVIPSLPMDRLIRSFSGLRPNPFYMKEEGGGLVPDGRSISSFTLLEEEGGAFLSMIGIKTPGLTCAAELGRYAAGKITAALGIRDLNGDFSPVRRAPLSLAGAGPEARRAAAELDGAYSRIVCRCRGVSEGEIVEAIRRGAVTVDGVKRRTGAGMGRCQGGFCTQRVIELLARETGRDVGAVLKAGPGSYMIEGGRGDV